MKPVTRQVILLGLLVLGIWFYETMRPIPQPPGILAPDAPQVLELANKPKALVRNGHVFEPLARLQVNKARVLSVERYGRDRESKAVLLDVVLGWGRMSDSVMLKNVDVAQSERRVLSKSYDPAFTDADVERSLANLHLVTSDAEVEKLIRQLRAGNIVRLEGYLVEAVATDGWRWKGQPRKLAPELPSTLVWVERLELEQQAASKS